MFKENFGKIEKTETIEEAPLPELSGEEMALFVEVIGFISTGGHNKDLDNYDYTNMSSVEVAKKIEELGLSGVEKKFQERVFKNFKSLNQKEKEEESERLSRVILKKFEEMETKKTPNSIEVKL